MDSQTKPETMQEPARHIIDPDGDLIRWMPVRNIWIEHVKRAFRKPLFKVNLEMDGRVWKYRRNTRVEAEAVRSYLIDMLTKPAATPQ